MANKKIPADATNVFSTKLFQVYTKEMPQLDGSFKTFERVRTYDIAKAICVVDDKIILLHEERPGGSRVGLPGGMIEVGEESVVAVAREVEEETGIIFDVYEKLVTIESNIGLVESQRDFYIARSPRVFGEQKLDIPGGEKIKVEYVNFDAFLHMLVTTNGFSGLSDWVIKEYILPGKTDELKKLLFG